MAVGITTTDGKDLDERYIQKVSGVGPDENGNVEVPEPPVISVQGGTGAVHLRLQANENNVSMSHTFSDGETYSYTLPVTGVATFSASCSPGKDYRNEASGEEDAHYRCTNYWDHTATLRVYYNGAQLYAGSSEKTTVSFSRSNWNLNKGDVIKVYMAYGRFDNSCPPSRSCSLSMDPMEIVSY